MQPQPPIIRRYATDAQYTADATALLRAGWRVASVSREPTGAIVATYIPPSAPVPADPQRAVTPNVALGGALIVAILAAALLAHALSGITGASSPSALQPTPTTFLQVTTATTNPNAAATILASDGRSPAGAAMITRAQIGGPLSAFDSAYGPEASQDTWNTTLNGQPVQLIVGETRLGDSADGTARAVVIDIDGADTAHSWTMAQEAALVASFLPPDAKHTKDVAGYGQLGTDHIYISQDLAASLTPSVFENAANQQLTSGTFDWQCSTQQQVCEIGAGTNS